MAKKINMMGMRFGRLVVVDECGNSEKGLVRWRCMCDCGSIVTVTSRCLRYGETKSCGCAWREAITTHGKSHTRLYEIWNGMIIRCNNKNCAVFKHYGGRGIAVCEEWSADIFPLEEWAQLSGYEEHLTLERIDNDGPYSPENCRWATMKEQSNNRRNNHFVSFNGEKMTVAQLADKFGIRYGTLWARLKKGASPEAAVFSAPEVTG